MQARSIHERELIKTGMTELCKKAGFADAENMVQRDLEFLSESIESKTGVLISLSTIKRLLNGQFSRLPQIATLNAIAMFLGYQNWQGFKLSQSPATETIIPPETDGAGMLRGDVRRGNRSSYTRWLLIGVLSLLVMVGLLAMLQWRKPRQVGNIENARFSADKVTSNDLPNTVVFSYNIDDVTADSFFIQQSWDENRRVKIYKNNYTLTDIYYEPGYHTAKLIANDQIIKTVGVSIPTDRWFSFAKERTPASIPKYILPAKEVINGSLQFTRDDLLNSQVDIQKEQEYVQVYFPTSIENSSDNFRLKFRIRVNKLNNDFCPYFMCEVFCQYNFMFFTSTPKGCTSEIKAQFGETRLSGKNNDLSALGSDVNAWQEVELIIKDKKVGIRINNTEVLSTSYHQSGGLITGLGFISNGLSEVDLVDFKTTDGKIIYSNDFEQ